MAAIHKPTWEKAGIFDAIMSSVYPIKRDEELVYRLAEKWCPTTNSFVFPWGEATVTLEDMASIRKETIPIAIHLARGIRIALAPPVLAGVYRHLSIFKCLIVQSRQPTGSSEDACLSAGLWTPFQMVQV
ncbi:hypothetical protein LINGRAHAP2_LOCUS9794 [Linum grandiflorum]